MDAEGIVVSALPAEATLVYVTRSHQFPLGVTMSLRRRRELLDWTAAANAWIVEHDYDTNIDSVADVWLRFRRWTQLSVSST